MVLERIKKCGIVPVIKINDVRDALSLAQALLAGGVDVMEVTFRTAAAKAAIEQVVKNLPEMLVGAGTVLTQSQLSEAQNAGAKFIVSPGFNAEIVKSCLKIDMSVFPGCVTPTEIMSALNLGLKTIKFFPAENYGGLNTLKALSAPFGDISFIPTGGINEKNAASYWQFSKVLAIGGSWMATEDLITSKRFDEITRLTKEAVEMMKSVWQEE